MVKIGIIGCGGIGRLHAGVLRNLKGAKVIAAADIDRKALSSFQKDFGVEKVFTDYRDLLKNVQLQQYMGLYIQF